MDRTSRSGWPGRLVASLAAASLGLGTWAFLTHAATHRRRALEGWAARLGAMADDRKLAIDFWLRDGLEDARTIASYPTARYTLAGGGPRTYPAEEGAREHLRGLLRAALSRQQYAAGTLLDASFEVVDTEGNAPPGLEAKATSAARRVVAETEASVEILGSPSTPTLVLFVAPVLGEGTEPPLGAVALAADPGRFLFPLLRGERLASATAEAMLARREGREAVFLSSARFRPGGPLSLRRPLDSPGTAMRHALAGEETFGEFLDYRGVPVLAVTRRLATVPWGLLVKVDTDEALAPERRHVALEATMLLGALAGLAALGYVVRRQEKGALSAALQRSGAREAALLDHANDPLLFLAPDGLIREANRRAAEFYGLPRERLLGRSVFDLRSEDERSRAREEHQAVLDDGSAVHEAVHVDAAGRGRPVEVSSRLVEVGEGPTVVSIVRDIAARKDQESHILLLSRLYRTLSQVNQLIVRMPERQTLLDGVCGILSGEGGFPLAWVGLKEDDGRVEIVARDGEAAAYARDLEVRWDETPLGQGPGGRALRDGRPVVVPDVAADPGFGPWASRARKHDLGTVGVFPIPIDGKAVGVVAVYATEIGAIREDEQALLQELAGDVGLALDRLETREEHERTAAALEAFFRSDVVGILFGTVDGRILEANDALLRIIGYSRAELERGEVGWKDITPPEHLPKDDAAIAEAKEKGACTPYEKEYIRKDGRRVWVLVGFALLQPERERSVAFILDVTEAREAEEESRRLNVELESRVRRRTAELEVASADLEAFSDSVSHDLRAPLRTIDGFARALEEEHGGRLDAEGRRVLSMVRENAAGMDRLIDDLLAFAQAARRKLEPTRVEMGRLAREAFEELASRHDIEGLELRVARLEAIEGDPALLKQVWSNLLSNALESTRGRSPRLIDVDSEAGSGEVRYLVRDNRVGFDLRYPGKLFDAFQRVHPPGELEGTGVGLALVRRIVSRHGGRVGAEGRPGEGALSWFSLPRPGRRL